MNPIRTTSLIDWIQIVTGVAIIGGLWLLIVELQQAKALTRAHYERIAQGREYFGDFDPFGDFDLIFGASKLNLRIIDIPVPYGSRSYGESEIRRFQHGALLLRMFWFAFRKLKSI